MSQYISVYLKLTLDTCSKCATRGELSNNSPSTPVYSVEAMGVPGEISPTARPSMTQADGGFHKHVFLPTSRSRP